MNIKTMILLTATAAGLTLTSCKTEKEATPFKWQVDQFADVRIMRYQIPEFDSLTPNQKILVYYLSEAAKCGRDIIWDQNYKYNLTVRSVLESIYSGYTGDRNNANWEQFMVYLKRVWFSNGIHHHYSNDKFIPEFSQEYFAELVKNTPADKFNTTLGSADEIITNLTPVDRKSVV